jgi:hypothetical protein
VFRRFLLLAFPIVIVVTQPFHQIAATKAIASQSMKYTMSMPFERFFFEERGFKPPMKFSKGDDKYVLSSQCKEYIGEKPQVVVGTASGKLASKTKMRPSHRLISARWIRDDNGENVYRFEGRCIFVANVSLNLPTSNFYTFHAFDEYVNLGSDESYPYTLAQLKSMKNGITQVYPGPGRNPATYSPVPEIETPKVQVLGCIEGDLKAKTDDEENPTLEKISKTFFTVANSVYRAKSSSRHSPQLLDAKERPEFASDFYLEFDDKEESFSQPVSQDTTVFTTWRKFGEPNFKFTLRAFYSRWGYKGLETAKQKDFTVQISSNCKNATVTLP